MWVENLLHPSVFTPVGKKKNRVSEKHCTTSFSCIFFIIVVIVIIIIIIIIVIVLLLLYYYFYYYCYYYMIFNMDGAQGGTAQDCNVDIMYRSHPLLGSSNVCCVLLDVWGVAGVQIWKHSEWGAGGAIGAV
jgi:hypothetical protein